MGYQLSQVKELKEQGKVIPLDKNRGKARVGGRIIGLLKSEVLSIPEIKDRLNLKERAVYNSVRRFEKKGLLVALEINGTTHYVEKQKAQEAGLVEA